MNTRSVRSQIVIEHWKGKARPYFCCYHCGKLIQDGTGSLWWDPNKPEETFIVCEDAACETLQEKTSACDSMELGVMWVYLERNTPIDAVVARSNADTLSGD